jgi:prepilin-type N-terminal cleavage/methylation domain-containing protein
MSIRKRPAAAGFTFIEIIVVVGIIGIFLVASFPSILNTMEARNLENAARRIQTYFQQTRNRAVDTKIIHRVRFTRITETVPAYWTYDMERFQVDGTWVKAEGAPRKAIPAKFAVTFALPADGADFVVDFSPVGSIVNFTTDLNSITLQSPKLDRPGQMDQRVLNLFLGGSIQYLKQKS